MFYIYFCGNTFGSIIFFIILTAFQCYYLYYDYAESVSIFKANGRAAKLLAMYRLLGWLSFCLLDHDYGEELRCLIEEHGNLTFISTYLLDYSVFIYAMSPSFSKVFPFQIVLSVYTWLTSEFIKSPEATSLIGDIKPTVKSKVVLGILLLYVYMMYIYSLVIAIPLLRTKMFANRWEETACIYAVFAVIGLSLFLLQLFFKLFCKDCMV